MTLVIGLLVAATAALGWKARLASLDRRVALVRARFPDDVDAGPERPWQDGTEGERMRRPWRELVRSVDERILAALCSMLGAFALGHLAGPVGWPAGAIGGAMLPLSARRRRRTRTALRLEGQLGDLVESCALAVRTGLSIPQALEFAGGEAEEPMREIVARVFSEQRLGLPFDTALNEFASGIGTDDARLFVLVLTVHAKSGGDLAGALEDVASTIRQRIAVRRELRALSAQGRISGGVLGSLPLLFFLVLAASSRSELEPVYHSAAGIAMIGGGLAMQGAAYAWVRRLLRVEL
jgi:tight adherence protein B